MTPAPAICEGVTGATVRWAPYLLVGPTLSCNQIDGIFGPVTNTAAGHFQRDSHRTVGGVPGRRMSRPPGRSCPRARSPQCARAATVLPRTPDHQEEPR